MFDVSLLVLVQVDLEESATIEADPGALANDLGWVDEVIEDRIVDRHQRTASGPLLLQLVGLPGGFGQDSALGNEDDVFAGKLLFQLPDQPGLDLLEGLKLWGRNEDDDGLLALATVNLLGRAHEQLSELALEVRVDFQLEESLTNGALEIGWLYATLLLDFRHSNNRHLKWQILTLFNQSNSPSSGRNDVRRHSDTVAWHLYR